MAFLFFSISGRIAATSRIASLLVAGVFIASSLLKLASIEEFTRSLDSWILVPPSARYAFALAVPFIELFVGLMACMLHGRAWPTILILALLAIFTGAYAIEHAMGGSPKCSCFGELLRSRNSLDRLHEVVLRNGLLGSLAAWGLTGHYVAAYVTQRARLTRDGRGL